MPKYLTGFSDAVDAWYDDCSLPGRWSPRSQYFADLSRQKWVPVLRNTPLEQIRAPEILRLAAALARSHSVSWVAQSRGYFVQAWRWFMAAELVGHDPTRIWRRPRAPRKRPILNLSREELDRLAEACAAGRGIRDVAKAEILARFVRFAWHTGLRTGTVRRLVWSEVVDRAGGSELRIPGEKMKMGNDFCIPISAEARSALGIRGGGDELVFPWLPPANHLGVYMKQAARTVGVSDSISPHQLRKSFATRLLERGEAVPVVQDLGGWKSADILLKNYRGAIAAGRLRAAIERDSPSA